jgi:hypothetical protein
MATTRVRGLCVRLRYPAGRPVRDREIVCRSFNFIYTRSPEILWQTQHIESIPELYGVWRK